MTKQEARQLELEVDRLFSDALETECTVSMTLTRALRVQIGENFINVRTDKEIVDWIHWIGDYSDLKCYINKIFLVIRDNREKIDLLLKSYEIKLED